MFILSKNINFGIYIANHGISAEPQDYIDLAIAAEENNWNGFFLWDHIHSDEKHDVLDPFIILSAIASNTKSLKIGTMITPLARRRPWQIARQVTTLDRLSNGRFILGVGLGDPADFDPFFEDSNPKIRKEKLEESLVILQKLWKGELFSFSGKHFNLKDVIFLPKPKQETIPIWVGGEWPNKGPFRRAAKFQGVFPLKAGGEEALLEPEDIIEIKNFISTYRNVKNDMDIAQIIVSSINKDENDWINAYINAGITWGMECIWPGRISVKDMFALIESGPPL